MNNMKLAAKLVNILNTLGSVPKKGFNQNQNYHYMREVDVLEALKEELVKNKIILLTSSKLVEVKEKPKTDKNGNKVVEFITTVETLHKFVDSESGEEYSITSVGQGYDSLDKGASKAITASVKYALMKTFMISDEGSDIENDGVTPQAPAVKPTGRIGFNKPPVVAKPDVEEKKVEPIKENTVEQVVASAKVEVTKPLAAAPAATVGFRSRTLNSAPTSIKSKEPAF